MVAKTLHPQPQQIFAPLVRHLLSSDFIHLALRIGKNGHAAKRQSSEGSISAGNQSELTTPVGATKLMAMLEKVDRRLRVLLADDHETVRHGLRLLIDAEPDLEVIAEAKDGAEAIERGASLELDVAVIDVSMPGTSGIVATRKLKELRPDLPVVTLTRHADQTFLEELLRAGASAYVLKQSPHVELVRAIRAAAAGKKYIDPALMHHLAAPFAGHERKRTPRTLPALTDRETEVLRFVAQGYSNKEIAARLDLSNKTIEVHKANAMRKLGLSGRIELLQYALHVGWLHDA
jgi:two-component system, NarL family, response regulator NreC